MTPSSDENSVAGEQGLSVAFDAIMRLHQALGLPPLSGAVGEYEVGPWRIRVNGSGDEQDRIPPFHAYIEFNGWPAGMFNPFGGLFPGGELANEDTFIAAVEAEIQRIAGAA